MLIDLESWYQLATQRARQLRWRLSTEEASDGSRWSGGSTGRSPSCGRSFTPVLQFLSVVFLCHGGDVDAATLGKMFCLLLKACSRVPHRRLSDAALISHPGANLKNKV